MNVLAAIAWGPLFPLFFLLAVVKSTELFFEKESPSRSSRRAPSPPKPSRSEVRVARDNSRFRPPQINDRVASYTPPTSAIFPSHPPSTEYTLNSLTWEQFESLTGEIYRRLGWEVNLCAGLGPDGGIDLRLRKADETVLVQCKHWKRQQVGVREIREIFGVLISEKATRAIFVTCGTFTNEALQFAKGKPIEMVGESELRRLVLQVSLPGENLFNVKNWEQNFNLLANFDIPNCPRCGTPMTSQTGRRSGNKFWGCTHYPACTGKMPRRTDLREV